VAQVVEGACMDVEKFEKLKGGSLAETRTNLVSYYRFLENEAKKIVETTRGAF
jgi:hypothetical protein